MKYYLVDDNLATAKNIESIIKMKNLGTVTGIATDPVVAIEEITEMPPDIVIVDFLMDGMDGVEMITKLNELVDGLHYVMISKVSDKSMIQKAYFAGIDFFITKPINIVEVESVLNNLIEKIKMKDVINKMQSIIGETAQSLSAPERSAKASDDTQSIDLLLGNLGMLGERGVSEIRAAYIYMNKNKCEYGKEVLEFLEQETGDTAKNIEQRLRRTIKKGLTNAAAIALDDMYSDTLNLYANYVYDFVTIRDEMNLLKGANPTGGRVKISRFMNGLIVYGSKIK